MDHRHPLGDDTGIAIRPIVYIRPALAEELPAEVIDRADGVDDLYSVHKEDGERLALVKGRALAFALARQNDLTPVNVH